MDTRVSVPPGGSEIPCWAADQDEVWESEKSTMEALQEIAVNYASIGQRDYNPEGPGSL